MTDLIADRWLLDRPNSYIGRSVPRPNAPRLAKGRGAFVDDIETGGRTGHAAFVRSPHAHARIGSIDAEAARAAPGVIAVVTGPELAEIHDPWVGVLSHLQGLKSAPQYALPLETATWQGEAVVAVVAESRARAEDAAELVKIDWEVLPAVTDAETALDPATTVIHESLGDNLAWRRNADFGDIEAAYAEADHIVEETYVFARHTGVCVEPRAILADWNPGEGQLTVWHNNQCPHMVQNILATHFRLDEHRVRVIARDVGGSFGSRFTPMRTSSRPWGSRSCSSGRSSSWRTGWRASCPTSMRATSGSWARSPSRTTAPFSRSRSTRSAASVPTPCIRARAASSRTRS